VIVAHCASLGDGVDLDDPARPSVPNFELFLRLMGEERWQGRLFGELSAITLVNRDVEIVGRLLARTDLHERLVDGSDYPLPAIRVLRPSRRFARAGLLTEDESRAIDELFELDPLSADFALKRTLKDPRTGARFPPSIFMGLAELGY
jgi:uncharacterized protein